MVTAKNLQLLDTQGNNISPAVNIETLYYEEIKDNGTVYRNHIFKHFPVFVKYNGQPDVQPDGDSFSAEKLYTDILDYNRQYWPLNAPVTHMNINNILGNEDEVLWTSNAAPYEYTNPNTGTDILVSGITQNRLSKNNDFMRLDVSAYNLTKILEPYAYKNWVQANVDFLDTKVSNVDIYNSKYLEDVSLGKRTGVDIQIRKPIGSVAAGTDVNTLVGHRYNEVLDKLLFGPLAPELYPGVIKVTFPCEYKITDTDLLTYHNSTDTKYIHTSTSSLPIAKMGIIVTEMTLPGFTNWNNKAQRIPGCGKYTLKAGAKNGSQIQETGKSKDISFRLQHVNTFMSPTVNILNITSVAFAADEKDEKCKAIIDSIGDVYYKTLTEFNAVKMPVKVIATPLHNVSHKPNKAEERLYTELPGNDSQFSYEIDLYWPIKFGHGLTPKALKTYWIHGKKRHKIYATWNPASTFYVCVPKAMLCRQINPFPVLNRIMQNGKWCAASQWVITQVLTIDTQSNKTYDPGLAAYTVFKIQPLGAGATKHIEFAINLTAYNLYKAPKTTNS